MSIPNSYANFLDCKPNDKSRATKLKLTKQTNLFKSVNFARRFLN